MRLVARPLLEIYNLYLKILLDLFSVCIHLSINLEMKLRNTQDAGNIQDTSQDRHTVYT